MIYDTMHAEYVLIGYLYTEMDTMRSRDPRIPRSHYPYIMIYDIHIPRCIDHYP